MCLYHYAFCWESASNSGEVRGSVVFDEACYSLPLSSFAYQYCTRLLVLHASTVCSPFFLCFWAAFMLCCCTVLLLLLLSTIPWELEELRARLEYLWEWHVLHLPHFKENVYYPCISQTLFKMDLLEVTAELGTLLGLLYCRTWFIASLTSSSHTVVSALLCFEKLVIFWLSLPLLVKVNGKYLTGSVNVNEQYSIITWWNAFEPRGVFFFILQLNGSLPFACSKGRKCEPCTNQDESLYIGVCPILEPIHLQFGHFKCMQWKHYLPCLRGREWFNYI